MWIPFFLFFVLMVLDASMIFMNYARAQRVMQEFNRFVAVQLDYDCTAMKADLDTRLQRFITSANAQCQPVGTGTAVVVTMNTEDMDLTGATGWLGGMDVRMTSYYHNEAAYQSGA